MKKLAGLAILSITLIVSCKKKDNEPEKIVPGVYVCGHEKNSNLKYVAKYWKNGTPVNLSDGTKDAFATGIFISGNDIYVCGYEGGAYPEKKIAKYWKNGEAINLTDGTQESKATSIFVVNSDIYVSGSEGLIAKYWKNGASVDLMNTGGNPYANGSANAIFVSGNDVYVGGREAITSSGVNQATYWKNGVAVYLTNDNTMQGATINSIYVEGNDVYTCGYNGSNGTYWKNTTSFSMPIGTLLYSICIANNKLYCAGSSNSAATYWENSTPVTLMPYYSSVSAIKIVDNDIYIAGSQSTSPFPAKAVYWKNGTMTSLSVEHQEAYATGLAIVK